MAKPYMPLMMGDWIRGTRAMNAQTKGVYIGLLIHQYDNGFIPADMETLKLIEPEICLGSVWVTLSDKFKLVEPGKLQNTKLEEVRAFWNKQRNNGKKGGRPKEENPNNNPKPNPDHNHHIDYDLDQRIKEGVTEILIDNLKVLYSQIDVDHELKLFKVKVKGAKDHYRNHDSNGMALAFQAQLRGAKPKKKGPKTDIEELQEIKNRKPITQTDGPGSYTSPAGSLD